MASGSIQGELWGARARDWADVAERTTQPLWVAMLEAVGVSRGTKLLDLGCGAGGASVLAAQLGANVTGVDASTNLIEVARERMPETPFQVGEIEDLPFPDGSFDVVFAANVFQFADDQRKAVREARRVLDRGGRLVVGMWCEPERNEMGVFMKAIGPLMPPTPESPSPPSIAVRENLVELLEGSGFHVAGEGEVACEFSFSNREELRRGMMSPGLMVLAARAIGEEKLAAALLDAAEQFRQPDGSYRFTNWFRWMVCH